MIMSTITKYDRIQPNFGQPQQSGDLKHMAAACGAINAVILHLKVRI